MKLPFASDLAIDDFFDKFINSFCGLLRVKRLNRQLNPAMFRDDGIYVSRNFDQNDASGRIIFRGNRIICLPVTYEVYHV